MNNLPRRSQIIIGIAGVVLLVSSTVLGIRASLGEFDPGYEITGHFARGGQGLDTYSDVRVRGITIGSVRSIELSEDNEVVVTMRIDPDVQVPVSTRARVQALSIFGPKFIELVLGDDETTGPFLGPHGSIPLAQTVPSTDLELMLDRTNDLFGAIDGLALVETVHVVANTFDGQGPTFGAILDNVEPLLGMLERLDPQTRAWLHDLAEVGRVLGPRGDDLVGLARELRATLPALTGLDPDLTATLDATTLLAIEVVDLLDANRERIAETLDAFLEGVLPILRAISSDLGSVPALIDAVQSFSRSLDSVIRLEREGGLLVALEVVFPFSVCTLFPELPLCDLGAP